MGCLRLSHFPSCLLPPASIKADQNSSLCFPQKLQPLFLHPRAPRYSEHLEVEEDIESRIVQNKKRLSGLSSWGIGGPCRYFLSVSRPSQLVSALRYCRSRAINFVIIGNGSNCLFSDQGFDGLVMLNRLGDLEVLGPGVFRVGSGYALNKLGVQCSNAGYSGLEFAGGIPGTVGGAAFMNAGAHGQETGNVIDGADIVTLDGRFQEIRRSQLAFGYRWSSFQEMADLAAITAVTFKLMARTTAREQQRAFLKSRKNNQPLGERNAGSVFKNPRGLEISAGELIELAGLKGYEIGGARVSDVHANFFINYNAATSWEMLALINFVKERVFQTFGIELEEEIKYVPYRT